MVVVEVEVGQTGDVVVERRRRLSPAMAMDGGLWSSVIAQKRNDVSERVGNGQALVTRNSKSDQRPRRQSELSTDRGDWRERRVLV